MKISIEKFCGASTSIKSVFWFKKMVDMKVQEVNFPLKCGKIAGKWWGSRCKRPIILLHGWQDNAGSFDALIPLLPLELSYLALDLPGHGLSSHYPAGCFYHINDMASILEELRAMFKWERISLIAHSMGVLVSFVYATLFPMRVDFVCALDTLKPVNLPIKNAAQQASTRMKKLYHLNSKTNIEVPEYNYDEMKDRIYEGSLKSLNRDKVHFLMARGVKSSKNYPNKFQLTRDIRIKFINPLFIERQITACYIKEIKAAYLYIKTDDRTYEEPPEIVNEALELFRKYSSHFEMIEVNGTHHVHLNNPERVAPKINEFIQKHHIQGEHTAMNDQGLQGKL